MQYLDSILLTIDNVLCVYRIIRELDAQLEYEREKREKLESQLDRLRAKVHSLNLQLEDARSEIPTVSNC